jgi:hypothetical protein
MALLCIAACAGTTDSKGESRAHVPSVAHEPWVVVVWGSDMAGQPYHYDVVREALTVAGIPYRDWPDSTHSWEIEVPSSRAAQARDLVRRRGVSERWLVDE